MHLAGECFVKLRANLERAQRDEAVLTEHLRSYDLQYPAGKDNQGSRLAYELSSGLLASEYALSVVRAAALLHDVGHCPYSHCSERFLPTYEEIFVQNPDLPQWLKFAMQKSDTTAHRSAAQGLAYQSCHEAFSLMIAWHILTNLDQVGACPVYKEDVLAVLNPYIEIHPDSPFHASRGAKQLVGWRILRDLLSGLWDVDRMDYLKRDSQQSGVPYGEFDADRIIHSMYGVYDTQTDEYYLGFHIQAAPALEGFLRARQSMFLQIYFHKTSVASEAMILHLSRLLNGWSFHGNMLEYTAVRDQDLERVLRLKLAQHQDLSDERRAQAARLIDGLFVSRQLWKKVYEQRSACEQQHNQHCKFAEQLQTRFGEQEIAAEVITASSQLARAQDMQRQGGDAKYRWITQDSFGFLSLAAANPLQNLLAQHPPFWLVRVYVAPAAYLDAKALIQQLNQQPAELD